MKLHERREETKAPSQLKDPVCRVRVQGEVGLHEGTREKASLFRSGNGAAAGMQRGGHINGSV